MAMQVPLPESVKLYESAQAKLQETTKDVSKLSDDERWRYEHQLLHEKHKGHETMHAEMIVVLIVTIIVAQIALVEWKKRHYKSYQLSTLVAMWVIPIAVCVVNHWWRFIIIWVIFSCITGVVISRALHPNVVGTTPRMVYKWFYLIYKLSYVFGLLGYIVMMVTLLGLHLLFKSSPELWMDVGLLLLFYGLYYGVLGRDFAEICTDKMAARIGYYTPSGIPQRHLDPNVCAVCGNKILVDNNEDAVLEKTYILACTHTFHEFCIRGWCIVGKKQTCPYCKEKVDLKRMFKNPWEKPHVLYGQLLDWLRYLVAWQPLIVASVRGINYLLGLE